MPERFGLIGYPLGHSFSRSYFSKKFEQEGLRAEYLNFPLESISDFPALLNAEAGLQGLNVTIPYKESIRPYLHHLDELARKVGAVNTIHFSYKEEGRGPVLTGYNTDLIGFANALKPLLRNWHTAALVLGSGGAAKAVIHVLGEWQIDWKLVSRRRGSDRLSYAELSRDLIRDYPLIINTSPLGMHPNTRSCPRIPYEGLGARHLLFDLVYNPSETLFMKKGLERGATVSNGYCMLVEQAEAAWRIWNNGL